MAHRPEIFVFDGLGLYVLNDRESVHTSLTPADVAVGDLDIFDSDGIRLELCAEDSADDGRAVIAVYDHPPSADDRAELTERLRLYLQDEYPLVLAPESFSDLVELSIEMSTNPPYCPSHLSPDSFAVFCMVAFLLGISLVAVFILAARASPHLFTGMPARWVFVTLMTALVGVIEIALIVWYRHYMYVEPYYLGETGHCPLCNSALDIDGDTRRCRRCPWEHHQN